VSIHLKPVLSFDALVDLSERMDWAPLYAWVEPDTLAWLVCKLKHVPDTPDVFPHGKWALIQHLTVLLDEEAQRDVTAAAQADQSRAGAARPGPARRPA
jgi:hypothetical protein